MPGCIPSDKISGSSIFFKAVRTPVAARDQLYASEEFKREIERNHVSPDTARFIIANLEGKYIPYKWTLEFDDVTEKDNRGRSRFSPTLAASAVVNYMLPIMSEADDRIYVSDGQIYLAEDKNKIIDKTLCEAVGDLCTAKMLQETMRRIENELLTKKVKLNPNPFLLAVKNLVIDLKTGELHEFWSNYCITDRLSVLYHPDARCPQFMAFLESITSHDDDKLTLVDFMVACAVREPWPYILFLLGRGRNGKGVYERVLKRFFGLDNIREMQLEEVNRSGFARGYFQDVRLWVCTETESRTRTGLSTEFLKLASGAGLIDADVKYRDRIKYEPFFQTLIDSNMMPEIADSSLGWQERFIKISLPYSFVENPDLNNPQEKKRDVHMFDKLVTDQELSGILNLIVCRAQQIIQSQSIHRRPSEQMHEEYEIQSDPVDAFLREFCDYEFRSSEEVVAADLIDKYKKWSELNVTKPVSDKEFGSRVKAYCDGNESDRARRDGKVVTIYRGLSFDEENYNKSIQDLESRITSAATAVGARNPDYRQLYDFFSK